MACSEALKELQRICGEVSEMEEGGVKYIHLPNLKLPAGSDPPEVEALLRAEAGPDGYTTRLFLSSAYPTKGQNWTIHRILDKTWHTFSFNRVPADLRLIEILLNHLAVLR